MCLDNVGEVCGGAIAGQDNRVRVCRIFIPQGGTNERPIRVPDIYDIVKATAEYSAERRRAGTGGVDYLVNDFDVHLRLDDIKWIWVRREAIAKAVEG